MSQEPGSAPFRLTRKRHWWMPGPLLHLADSFVHPAAYRNAAPRLEYLARYARWSLATRRGPQVHSRFPEKLTVILLSYNRPQNLHAIVRSLLRASFIDRIILSNNNPDVRMEDWVQLRDDRLRILNQPRRTPCGIRFKLALEEPGRFFAAIDDDLFLSPEQVRDLFEALVTEPYRPHGARGILYAPDMPFPFPKERIVEIFGHPIDFGGWRMPQPGTPIVDVLNGLYFFTRAHLEEMFRLAGLLGHDIANLGNGEDILLSFGGDARPRLHDLGDSLLACLTEDRPGVATWRESDFFKPRSEMVEALKRLKPLGDEPPAGRAPDAAEG